jgi:hypothetical protein
MLCLSMAIGSQTVSSEDGLHEVEQWVPELTERAESPGKEIPQPECVRKALRTGMVLSSDLTPLYFIENRGQVDDTVAYFLRGTEKTLYFTSKGVTTTINDVATDGGERWVVKLVFIGANPAARPRGEDKRKAVFSYFRGKPEGWKTGIPTFGRLVYRDLWPGIDLMFSGTVNRLKYAFLVRPGADPGKVRMAYLGVSNLSVDEMGRLKIATPAGSFTDDVPAAYQETESGQRRVSAEYSLIETDRSGRFTYGFKLGSYDPDKPLILDPALLVYCGFIGGIGQDRAYGVAVDGAGCAYVTGYTDSDASTFPVKVGPYLTLGSPGEGDAFVAKVNPAGTELLYCGYIGGSGVDIGMSIAVDRNGCAYVTGQTNSSGVSFPVKVGPYLHFGGHWDCFVAKVNALGTDLDYCGFIGGTGGEYGAAIDVDREGNAYVAGEAAPSTNFPVKVGPDLTSNGNNDGFVAKVNALGDDLDYCGYIGGIHADYSEGIAVDHNGNAYVTGSTLSDERSFPVKVGPDLTYNGGGGSQFYGDAYVAKVEPSGEDLVYCGFIGGNDSERGLAIAVDKEGRAYVTGDTKSDENTFPVTVGPSLVHQGEEDAFVARVNVQGTDLEYCGFIGGVDRDIPWSVAVDDKDRAYLGGLTDSTESSFPVTAGPDLTFNGGTTDGFVARIDASGAIVEYCGYIGGDNDEWCTSIKADPWGHAFVAGFTLSSESTFPSTVGPDTTFNGYFDAFVARVAMALSADVNTLPIEGDGVVNFVLSAGVANANRNYLLLGSVSGTSPGTVLPGGQAVLPLNLDYFTDFVILKINTKLFFDFLGTLNAFGDGTAQLNTKGMKPISPGCIGTVMHFAYFLSWDFASNPVAIEIE